MLKQVGARGKVSFARSNVATGNSMTAALPKSLAGAP